MFPLAQIAMSSITFALPDLMVALEAIYAHFCACEEISTNFGCHGEQPETPDVVMALTIIANLAGRQTGSRGDEAGPIVAIGFRERLYDVLTRILLDGHGGVDRCDG